MLQGADLFICTSHDEGLGLPLLEAQYGGLPVVAPDAAIFHEVLGVSGIFVDPADPVAAATTIEPCYPTANGDPLHRACDTKPETVERVGTSDRVQYQPDRGTCRATGFRNAGLPQ